MKFPLVLLGMASQRIEYLVIELFGNDWLHEILAGWKRRERGCIPGFVETGVIIYVISKQINAFLKINKNNRSYFPFYLSLIQYSLIKCLDKSFQLQIKIWNYTCFYIQQVFISNNFLYNFHLYFFPRKNHTHCIT